MSTGPDKAARAEFARRRKQLKRMMGENSIAILFAAPERVRSRDVAYRYRQDSDFYYLTGFTEPESVAVLIPGRPQGEFVLFCRERNPERELWDGQRAGTDGACDGFGADDAFPIDDIGDILPGLIEGAERVFYTMGQYPDCDAQVTDWVCGLRGRNIMGVDAPTEMVALDHYLHDMRLYKSRYEITRMRKAAKVAVSAHKRAMRAVVPGMTEFSLEAEYLHEFRLHDGVPSYPPIVGGGQNACVLHYTDNANVLTDGDLVLVDAGCEIDYYASDVTRTFPVNGCFSDEQRALYEVVLEAQLAAIDATRAGNHWNEPHLAATRVITEGLRRLGILSGGLKTLLKNERYREFFMHRTGHWLGIDVHDVGDYMVDDTWRLLEPGMVITVEPGIYIPHGSSADARWQGIGIRIEDDVLVTKQGPDELSKGLPKSVQDIERWMQGGTQVAA
ncbi:MAG: aminopeptidase P N-terminal domain-containing protein [Pseudomonadota bacterium]